MKNQEFLDKAVVARVNEKPDLDKLHQYLLGKLINTDDKIDIEQFPGGYSNLTFLLKLGDREYVLRKPPIGANIKTAHDMHREFQVLKTLQPVYDSIPQPILYCEDVEVIGTAFYIMERVNGIILRNRIPKGLNLDEKVMRSISEASVDNLAKLHGLDIESSGLIQLGKPEGYIKRQVEGWTKRYVAAETDPLVDMHRTSTWLQQNMKENDQPAFIHNDYKYDNLVLDPENLDHILAVLDWEMATVGSPLMDLGTTLAYWAEAEDNDALKPFNLTWLPGNLTREQVLHRYADLRNVNVEDFLFYYVFGSFKVGVIVQQIYARYRKGFTQDERFAGLIHVVKALGANAQRAIKFKRISNFY